MARQITVRPGDRRQIVITLVQSGSPQLDLTGADRVYLDYITDDGTTSYADNDADPVFTVDSAQQITITPPSTFFPAVGDAALEIRAVYGPKTYFCPSEAGSRITVAVRAA